MAYRSAPIADDLIWRTPLPTRENAFAESVRAKIAEQRPHMLELFRLNEVAPDRAKTLVEWAKPTELSSLLAVYSDHIYRHQPTEPRENKPLISLWAQWYIGLLVPPLMLALLTEESATISASSFTRPAARPASGSMYTTICVPAKNRLLNEWIAS